MQQNHPHYHQWTDQEIARLTPVRELAEMGDLKGKFHYDEVCQYVASCGLDIENFYYNRSNHLTWFCYYHDLVWLEFPYFTLVGLQTFRMIDRIRLEEETLNGCLQSGDYKALFHMIHPRILLPAFVRLSSDIPQGERYRLMGLVYARTSQHLEQYPRDFVESVLADRIRPLSITGTDDGDEVVINYGQGPCAPPVERATSWTLDINTAIFHATRHDQRGILYQARVAKEHIIGYIKRRNEKEILVYPEHIYGITQIDLPGYQDMLPLLEMAGILEQYHQCERLLRADYFYRPYGIHGIDHTRRVLLLLLILTYHEYGMVQPPTWMITAALYHDIGRSNDNYDPSHGLASYAKAMSLNLLGQLGDAELEMTRFVIENHCVEDNEAKENINRYQIENREDCLNMFWVLKDADALDRIRINDLDVGHLRTPSSHELLWVARDLLDRPALLENPI